MTHIVTDEASFTLEFFCFQARNWHFVLHVTTVVRYGLTVSSVSVVFFNTFLLVHKNLNCHVPQAPFHAVRWRVSKRHCSFLNHSVKRCPAHITNSAVFAEVYLRVNVLVSSPSKDYFLFPRRFTFNNWVKKSSKFENFLFFFCFHLVDCTKSCFSDVALNFMYEYIVRHNSNSTLMNSMS